MASSSSSSHKTLKYYSYPSEVAGEEIQEKDWLELGLGSSSSNKCKKNQEVCFGAYNNHSGLEVDEKGVKLGLEIGGLIGGGDHNYGVDIMEAPPHTSSNNNNYHYSDGSGQEIHHHHHHGCCDWPMWPVRNDQNRHCGPTRVVMPHSSGAGLWFTLRSSTNREGEALPQIPKAYIRVKDENVTVFMVKKYLVTKLGLSNEAEIDIRCMGHELLHTQTLKQVRDAVWLPELIESVNSSVSSQTSNCNSSVNHLMPLHYTRRCIFN